jgi:hypothetical protein
MFIAILAQSYDNQSSKLAKKMVEKGSSRIEAALLGFFSEKLDLFLSKLGGLKEEIKKADQDGDGIIDKQELEL